MSNIKFRQERIDVGIIEPGSSVKIEFPYEGDRNNIVSVHPECGCTADVNIAEGVVTCVFTETGTEARAKIPNLKQTFPSGYEIFLKSLTVYVNDGRDMHILDNNNLVLNPEKEKIRISFTGKVRIW